MKKSILSLFVLAVLFILFLFFLRKVFEQPKLGIKYCDEMGSNELKLMCYAMFLKDYKYCSLVGPSYSFCVDFVSSTLQLNESFCRGLEGYKKMSCTTTLAIKNKDPSICDLLGGSEFYSCYYSLASYLDYLKISEEFCNKIREESLKFICLAKLKNDIKLCENIIQEPFEKWNCLATISGNTSYCSKSDNFNYCLSLVALGKKNTELCDKIEAQGTRIDCLVKLKKSLEYCKEFEGKWKDYCVLNYLALKNLGIL